VLFFEENQERKLPMNRWRKLKSLPGLLLAAWALNPLASQACAACYGEPDSKMSKGLVAGISVLLVVVVGVLAGISTFFVYISKKSSTEPPAESATESSTDKV
jgi:hypothetical protein